MSTLALFRHTILALQRNGSRLLAERLREIGLTPAWGEVLAVIGSHGALSIRELGRLLVCEADHPSRLVSRMEEAGLIVRYDHPEDARAFQIRLTPKGERAEQQVRKLEAKWDAEIAKLVTEPEIDAVLPTLLKLLHRSPSDMTLRTRYPKPMARVVRGGERSLQNRQTKRYAVR